MPVHSLSQTDSCKYQGKRTWIPKPLNGTSEESQFRGSVNSERGEDNGSYQWGGDQQWKEYLNGDLKIKMKMNC